MEEALALRAAAKKKTHSVSALFSKLGGSKKSSNDAAEAEELYTRAANLFLGQRQFSEAADSFVRAASVAPSVYSAASLNVEAAKAWRSANEPQFAAKYYAEAIALFARHGPLRRAALVCTELAQLYDEASQPQLSLKTWNRAAELYDDQHDGPHAAQARLGAADVAARVGDFLQAIERYEAAAEECAKDTLTRFKLKQYFLRSGLCYLAEGDTIGLEKALTEKYTRWDRAFSGTIEYRLLVELRKALIEREVARFEQAMYNYDTKHRLGKWELEVALKVKDRFSLPPEDEIL